MALAQSRRENEGSDEEGMDRVVPCELGLVNRNHELNLLSGYRSRLKTQLQTFGGIKFKIPNPTCHAEALA